MANLTNVAKKEIADIAGNMNVSLIMLVYVLLILSSAMSAYDWVAGGNLNNSQLLEVMLGQVSNAIMTYGSIIAIMVGFSSITNEKMGNALATLTTKPLYRDTIINGKLFSCTVFMLFVFGMATILYTSILMITCGSVISPALSEYLSRLPFVFVMSAMVAFSYMSISFLFPIWIKNHGVALLLTVITFMMLKVVIPTVSFAGNVYILTGNGEIYDWIRRLCPDTSYSKMMIIGLYDPSISVMQVVSECWTDIAAVLLFTVIVTALTYISFVRRDIG